MKKLSITLVALLAATPALAAPTTLTITDLGRGRQSSAGSPGPLEILSGGRVVATMEEAPGQTKLQADKISYGGGAVTASGHVLVSVTRGGQAAFRISADEVRLKMPQPK